MYMTIPLAVTADILGFSSLPIRSWSHSVWTTDSTIGSQIWPYQQFRSSQHKPPHLDIKRYNEDKPLADGYLFLSPADKSGMDGTMELQGTGFVMTDDGELVFAAEEHNMGFCTRYVSGMTDFGPQEYDGRPYIVYWNGCNTRGTHWGHRWGRVTFVDDQYENFTINPELHIVTKDPANIGQIDMHEHRMAGPKSILVTSYNTTIWDLTHVGGSNDSWLADSLFFEVDVETGNILFEWAAADHIPLSQSRMPGAAHTKESSPWDWFHINSVQKIGENYLVSSRHLWSVFLVSGKDGSVIWTLDGEDGEDNDFGTIPQASQFKWQHHARAHMVSKDSMVLSVFNNRVNGVRENKTQTQGTALKLKLPPNKKQPVETFRKLEYNKDPIWADTQGSYEMDVGNGNGLLNYGSVPIMREFASDGTLLWSAQYGGLHAVQSYRVSKHKWHGTPKHWDPKLVLERDDGHPPRAYVSWNGATDIDAWAVYAGGQPGLLESVGVAPKHGFETAFELKDWKCVKVGAIRKGRILRSSNVACLEP